MGSALKFRHTNVPRQQGEQGRLKVVQGPDFGAIFVLTSARSTVGRGEENDVLVSDLKASRKHAEFALGSSGWNVKDLGSANGILHNGHATRAASLQTGDTVTLGETTLEFIAAEAGTMMLTAPTRNALQIQSDREALEQQKKNVRAMGQMSAASNEPKNNKRLLIYGVLGLGVAFLFMSDPPKNAGDGKNAKKKAEEAARDLASYLPGADAAVAKPVEQFFKAGFREYSVRNYLRAKSNFETVLQMSPGHPLATLYLENCNKQIEEEVKFHLQAGKKGMEAGRLKDAKGHYEAVLRMLFRDRSNPAYNEANDQLDKVVKEMEGKTS